MYLVLICHTEIIDFRLKSLSFHDHHVQIRHATGGVEITLLRFDLFIILFSAYYKRKRKILGPFPGHTSSHPVKGVSCVTYQATTYLYITSLSAICRDITAAAVTSARCGVFVSHPYSSIPWLFTEARYSYLLLFSFLFCTHQHLVIRARTAVICSSMVTFKHCTVFPVASRKVKCVLILQFSLYQQGWTLLSESTPC